MMVLRVSRGLLSPYLFARFSQDHLSTAWHSRPRFFYYVSFEELRTTTVKIELNDGSLYVRFYVLKWCNIKLIANEKEEQIIDDGYIVLGW